MDSRECLRVVSRPQAGCDQHVSVPRLRSAREQVAIGEEGLLCVDEQSVELHESCGVERAGVKCGERCVEHGCGCCEVVDCILERREVECADAASDVASVLLYVDQVSADAVSVCGVVERQQHGVADVESEHTPVLSHGHLAVVVRIHEHVIVHLAVVHTVVHSVRRHAVLRRAELQTE